MKISAFCLAFVCTVLLLQLSCKDKDCNNPWNPDCDNYNACLYEQPVSADFKMEEVVDPLLESDTVLVGSYVRFTAKQDLDSLDWQVGLDTAHHRNQKSFELYFNSAFGTLDVRLIGRHKPNHVCFPFDNGMDTVLKHLTVVPRSASPLPGHYHGYLISNPADTFSIELKDSLSYSLLKNLPNGCPTIVEVVHGFKQFHSANFNPYPCAGSKYKGYLIENNQKIVISYVGLSPGPLGQQNFIGKRVP